ncbi:M23 family metallopeptidase [Candidatus Falkowbacteria bacterium]|nr:M23 family metallopeptidase [Candidatus Falkowbacteria bacterium]
MNKTIYKYIILAFLALIFAFLFFNLRNKHVTQNGTDSKMTVGQAVNADEAKKDEKMTEVEVEEGDVFNKIGARGGLDASACYAIYDDVKEVYDLAKLRVGNKLYFYSDNNGSINKLMYAVDNDRELFIEKGADGRWSGKMQNIVYEVREKTVEGTIDSSLYESAMAAGADERAVLQFAEGLEWSIDFANDPRVGDKYKFVYEERYRDGRFVMPGKVLAGAYLNGDKLYQTFYFEESEDNKGYFDENGNSVQKMFLKAPLAFKYISSPFTTGRRYVEAFSVSTKHRAIDYAAAQGTPIRAIGDGTVTHAGWAAGYGNFTSINHNSTYSTNYGHQSKIIVKRGQRVRQGEVIGYVGSTGFSTGPHLHFEMEKNGVKVNPANEIVPPGRPIGDSRKADFTKAIDQLKEKIKI